MEERPNKDDYYLKLAEVVASRSTCIRKHYGAVIVKNDQVISTGYNGAPRGEANCCDTGICNCEEQGSPRDQDAARHAKWGSCVAVHAEQNAIINASRAQMLGGTLYLFCAEDPDPVPCNICDRMIRNAGLRELVTESRIKFYE